MLIFVDKISERLIYTFDFIFSDRAIAYQFTNDWNYYSNYTDLKFIYSDRLDHNSLQIIPSTLLFDEGIFEYALTQKTFYKEACLCIDKIVDPFASVFFVLSRMEEYTLKQRDIHNRFQLKNSVLAKFSWSKKVVCDRWAEDIIQFIENHFKKSFQANKIKTKVICTIDVDNTYAYKWKEGFRRIASIAKDYLRRDEKRILERKLVEKGSKNDPYDTFDYLKSLKNLNHEILFFWLLGDYNKFDKNISGNDLRHQKLIQEMSTIYPVYLHPSYESNSSNLILKNEKKLLETILKHEINSTRQHFLKLKLPTTYKTLISEGFTDDYSMGFAEDIGFRAGTARSHYFFDLTTNSKSNLRIHPLSFMDGSLNLYLKLTPNQAKSEIKTLFDEVKTFGGDFISIWHNETINDIGIWRSWKEVFEFNLNLKDEI
jgi:hypothetical protein